MRQAMPSPDQGGCSAAIGSAAAGAGTLSPGTQARYGGAGGGHSTRSRRQT